MDSETQSESESSDEPSDDSLGDEEEPSNVLDTNAEQEIEGDFEYVIRNISFIRLDFLIGIVALSRISDYKMVQLRLQTFSQKNGISI